MLVFLFLPFRPSHRWLKHLSETNKTYNVYCVVLRLIRCSGLSHPFLGTSIEYSPSGFHQLYLIE